MRLYNSAMTGKASVFRAVADRTRRDLLDVLLSGEKTASELCSHFPGTQQAVSLHLQNLRQAGLVEARKDGRFRRYRLRAEPIREIYEWIVKYRPFFDPYGHAWSFATAEKQKRSKRELPTKLRGARK
jgi:DNA-binding transcriptional ArsR family regulator